MSCLVCGGSPQLLHQLSAVPVHSVRLYRERAAARGIARGSIELVICQACQFVWNRAFQPELLAYRADYQPSQACSPTFNRFHHALAQRLLADWQLSGGEVLEVGCGDAAFLELLCAQGDVRGVGFDPACRRPDGGGVRVERRLFERGMLASGFDAVVCKMTLEHCAQPVELLRGLAEAARPGAPLFLMVPDARRILAEAACEDIYYEHCNYFLPQALHALAGRAGLTVEQLWTAYDEQYLLASLRREGASAASPGMPPQDVAAETFAERCAQKVGRWRAWLAGACGCSVLWGAGSKAVAFLSLLGEQAVQVAVDIDPLKQGGFLPGSGVPIVAPAALQSLQPGLVIVMNRIYRQEIAAELQRLGIQAEVRVL